MSACTCCNGVGEHQDGHECYVCDASGQRSAQTEMSKGEQVCEGHHGRPDDGPENAKDRYGSDFEHYATRLNVMRASVLMADGYEGVTHAGIALVAEGAVLLGQRTMDETDDPEVQETWEFPGGGLEPGEQPFEAALREFLEETGLTVPPEATVINGWRSEDGVYQGFVVSSEPFDINDWLPTIECQALGWFTREMIEENENLRPEVRDGTDWDMIFGVSGNSGEENTMTDANPDESTDEFTADDYDGLIPEPMMVHGILAPEEAESGDSRGFNAGSMTSRPLRLPFSNQPVSTEGHGNSHVIGSVDRMMRKDGEIHWEGLLMPSDMAEDFIGTLAFFGRYGVSVDGDRGSMDEAKTEASGVLWFDAVRAAGLTAVHIPAFAEAYVGLGPHPDMPEEGSITASAMIEANDIVGARMLEFKRGPGWVTDPKATNRIHDYWTKPGQAGYAKIRWGTPGDFTRAKALIGAKIAENSPGAMKYLNQIIAQWHHDALGYWPGTEGLPGNNPKGTAKRRYHETHASAALDAVETLERDDIEAVEDGSDSVWEAVLVSSASPRPLPPVSYFHRQDNTAALVIEDPDENGYRHVYGYGAQWGVCHVGMGGKCVEPPRTYSDDYPDFHLGRTKVEGGGYIPTGVLTYGVGHREADQILSESPTKAYFDNINNAWSAVRIGEDDTGIWFSGVVLPKMDEDHLVKIQASGQVSGEWLYGEMRAMLTVNVAGFPVQRASAAYDDEGNVVALAASALWEPYVLLDVPADAQCMGGCGNPPTTGVWGEQGDPNMSGMYCTECAVQAASTALHECGEDGTMPTPGEQMAILARVDAEARFENMKEQWV